MQFSKKMLRDLIIKEVSSMSSENDPGESVFKERELTHEISKTLNELSFFLEKAENTPHPTDMDTIEIPVKALKNWNDVLVKFLMAIGG